MERYFKKWFPLLILPAIVLFTLVIAVPFLEGVVYSFTNWRGTYFQGGEHWWNGFSGIKNYLKIFRNRDFLGALGYTTKYAVIAVVIQNIISLLLALLIQKIVKGKGFFRTVYFFPYLLGGLAMGYVWRFIFENVFTNILFGGSSIFHVEALRNMLQSSNKALFAFAILTTWQAAGYYLLIYLNGLNNIPKDLYEAAAIDGASAFYTFRRVTLPLLMPSFTVVLFLSLSGSFKMLDANIALTEGNFNTTMISFQILKTARETSPPEYGLAQAQAVIFFLIVAVISITQVILTKKREVEA